MSRKTNIMKPTRGVNRMLALTLLTATMVIPGGITKQAMGNTECRDFSKPAVQVEATVNYDGEYSVSVIRFFNWI